LNPDIQTWIEQLRSGDVRTLARAISIVENRAPGWSELLKALFPHSGKARVLGLTGPPGAGKSTLVDQLARFYRKATTAPWELSPWIPTSPYTGGAILGDRIRMQEHFSDPGIYIRSMATRGSLGGLARTTADVTTVLDASGRDLIMIETVGVGQDEVDIVRLADVTILILVPGMGDDVQTIKAGIMEIADIFVINKSDRDGAENVEREIRTLQSLAMRHDGWTPPIVKTVASQGVGIEELAAAISRTMRTYLQKENLALNKSVENWQERLIEMLRDAMLEKARTQLATATWRAGGGSGRAQTRSLYAGGGDRRQGREKLTGEFAGKNADGGSNRSHRDRGEVAGGGEGDLRETGPERFSRRNGRAGAGAAGDGSGGREPIGVVGSDLGDSTIAKFIAKRGEGLHHVCLRVPDLPAAVERLKKDGVRLVSEEIKTGAGGHRYVFVHPSSTGRCAAGDRWSPRL
jgi:LAO/AO transport system kinase